MYRSAPGGFGFNAPKSHFGSACDSLVKALRLESISTIEVISTERRQSF